jgi:sialidase-1
MTIRLSEDDCQTWPIARTLHTGPAAYSDLVLCADGAIGCLYECGEEHAYQRLTFARFAREWLTG